MRKRWLRYSMLLLVYVISTHPPVVLAQSHGKFIPASNMNFGRAGHTATLLSVGKVLIVGGHGINNRDFGATAELYDPISRKFELTGTVNWPRESHTATLLPDGKVLIAGGRQGSPIVNAEIYDPSTGNFVRTSQMAFARSGHTGTLLRNAKVLIAGGRSGSIRTVRPGNRLFRREREYDARLRSQRQPPSRRASSGREYLFRTLRSRDRHLRSYRLPTHTRGGRHYRDIAPERRRPRYRRRR
jgi:hypothetical protein